MTSENTTSQQPNAVRIIVIAVLVIAAFFGAYKFASALTRPAGQPQASGGASTAVAGAPAGNASAPSGSAAAGDSGCACCGTSQPTVDGVSGTKTGGTATLAGGVQAIAVDLSTGAYNPNVIKLKAGVPAEITFGQSSGCTSQVISKDLGFFEDLSQGPKTVKVPALKKGEYAFSCGMQMVFGKIVVE